MYKYTIEHLYPPVFAVINGQKYLMPGWIPVEDHITFSDVKHINPYKNLKTLKYEVLGSRGNYYTVTVTESKDFQRLTCTCPAGKFRGKCKHIDKIKNDLN